MGPLPRLDFFHVNQMDSVLNFARGQTPADDVCILKCILKHHIFRKIRATFLSLSEEKKATSAGLKRLNRSRRPLAYSLLLHSEQPKLYRVLAILSAIGLINFRITVILMNIFHYH